VGQSKRLKEALTSVLFPEKLFRISCMRTLIQRSAQKKMLPKMLKPKQNLQGQVSKSQHTSKHRKRCHFQQFKKKKKNKTNKKPNKQITK